jgi:predicted membrane protein
MSTRQLASVGGTPIALALVGLAVLFFALAVLYALGVLNILTSTSSGHHLKHAALLAVLGIASLIAANFLRRKAEPAS